MPVRATSLQSNFHYGVEFVLLVGVFALHGLPAAAQVPTPTCAATHYTITPLPLTPARINNSGVVAGTTTDHQPASWTQKDGLHKWPLPAGFAGAQIFGINPAGDLAGLLIPNGANVGEFPEKFQAFAFRHGEMQVLSDGQSKARAIDAAGEVVGEKIPDGPVVWNNQNNRLLALGGCCGGRALAVNEHNEVVGEMNDKQGQLSAFHWDTVHGIVPLTPPGSHSSTALAINDAGHVLLQSLSPNAVFIKQDSKFTSVELSPDQASQPLAFNNCDAIAGEFGSSSDYYRAFVWDQKLGFRDLNKILGNPDWVLESAVDINDRGEIVGSGDYKSNQDVGFLMVPMPTEGAEKPTSTIKNK